MTLHVHNIYHVLPESKKKNITSYNYFSTILNLPIKFCLDFLRGAEIEQQLERTLPTNMAHAQVHPGAICGLTLLLVGALL